MSRATTFESAAPSDLDDTEIVYVDNTTEYGPAIEDENLEGKTTLSGFLMPEDDAKRVRNLESLLERIDSEEMREEVREIKDQYEAVNNVIVDSAEYHGESLVQPEEVETYEF
jgi:hypothetical protein